MLVDADKRDFRPGLELVDKGRVEKSLTDQFRGNRCRLYPKGYILALLGLDISLRV